jgi:lysozyme family protein
MNPCDGLLLAGEYVTFVGIDGAIKSGQDAAIAVLQRVKEPVTQ